MPLVKVQSRGTENVGEGNSNVIINGGMQVSQRATSTTSTGYQTLDRFQFLANNTDQFAFTVAQSTTVPDGFANSLKVACTTAEPSLAADELVGVLYIIEGQDIQNFAYGTSASEIVTLSFYVRSNITGVFTIEFRLNGSGTSTITKQYTISSADTWERKIITLPTNTVTAITNDNSNGMEISFCLSAGSNFTTGSLGTTWATTATASRYSGQVGNIMSSNSNEWLLTGVQLEVGEQASDFQFESFGETLSKCQRYFFKINGTGSEYATMGAGQMYQTTSFLGYLKAPVPMRSRPSFSLSDSFSNANFAVVTGGHVRAISSLTLTGDNQYFRVNAVVSGATQGHGGYIQIQSGYNAFFSSEL